MNLLVNMSVCISSEQHVQSLPNVLMVGLLPTAVTWTSVQQRCDMLCISAVTDGTMLFDYGPYRFVSTVAATPLQRHARARFSKLLKTFLRSS